MKFRLVFLLGLILNKAYSQQAPTYSMYLNNQILVNPAVAGSDKGISINVSQRNQWQTLSGPTAQALSIHAPIAHKSIGVGAILVNEKSNLLQQLYLSTCYAYKINLFSGVLSFGLNIGAMQIGIDNQNIDPRHLDDTQLPMTNKKFWSPHFGTGLYYQSSRLQLSISSQHLQPFKNKQAKDKGSSYLDIRNVTYFIGSYNIPLTLDFSLVPALNFRHTQGGYSQMDAGIYIKEKHSCSIGVNYRNEGVLSFQLMLNSNLFFPKMRDQFSIGYAYDYAPSGLTNNRMLGNEIMIIYKIAPQKNISKVKNQLPNASPKFF